MGGKRIVVIEGHPDRAHRHFGHALADAYAEGARDGGHEVRRVRVAEIDFPVIRSAESWRNGEVPAGIREAQEAIVWANHVVLLYPLWLGSMPALLRAFLEQVFRPGFGTEQNGKGMPKKLLTGRSVRIVITMGMPAPVYRWFYGPGRAIRSEGNIFKFCGMKPVETTLIGMVDGKEADRRKWLADMGDMGRAAT